MGAKLQANNQSMSLALTDAPITDTPNSKKRRFRRPNLPNQVKRLCQLSMLKIMFLENMDLETVSVTKEICNLFALTHAFHSWCTYREACLLSRKLNEWLKQLKPLLRETSFLSWFSISDKFREENKVSCDDMENWEELFHDYRRWSMVGCLPNFFYLGKPIRNVDDPSLLYAQEGGNVGEILNIMWVHGGHEDPTLWYAKRRLLLLRLGEQILLSKIQAEDQSLAQEVQEQRQTKIKSTIPIPSMFLGSPAAAGASQRRKNATNNIMLEASLIHHNEEFQRLRDQAEAHLTSCNPSLAIVVQTKNAICEIFREQEQLMSLMRDYGEDAQEFLQLIQGLTQKRKAVFQALQKTVYSITDFKNGTFAYLTKPAGSSSDTVAVNDSLQTSIDEEAAVFGSVVMVRNICQATMQHMLPNVVDQIINASDRSMESMLPPSLFVPLQDYLVSRMRYPSVSSHTVSLRPNS